MAPMTRARSPGGIPGEDVAEYYARRAKGEVGLILTEGTWIDHPSAQGYSDVPKIAAGKSVEGWRRVTRRVHEEGGLIFCQLWHVGSYRKPGFDPERKVPSVSPSGIPHPKRVKDGDAHPPQELGYSEIGDLLKAYGRSAVCAKEAGFDGVEIHGAHGYLIDQFFWEKTNRRSDRYGGSLGARSRFAAEAVLEVKRSAGLDFPVCFRFSQWKLGMFEERLVNSPRDLEALLAPVTSAGVDVFHASTYRFDRPEFEGSDLNLAGWTRKITGLPAITVGGIGVDKDFKQEKTGDPATRARSELGPLVQRMEAGEFELAAVGRALIGDPEWPKKIREGRTSEIIDYDPSKLKTLW